MPLPKTEKYIVFLRQFRLALFSTKTYEIINEPDMVKIEHIFDRKFFFLDFLGFSNSKLLNQDW